MSATSEIDRVPLTFGHCLQDALESVERPVLSSPDQEPASGATVVSTVRTAGTTLREMGFEHSDRIAYALPDSAGTALLSLTIMSSAVAAPINPKLSEKEIENTLRNLKVKSLIVPAGVDSAARRAAKALSLHTIEFQNVPNSYAGHFELLAPSIRRASHLDFSVAETHHALVVQTSGTTGAPKIVALTHRNLLSMMLANVGRLELETTDRCLGVMPLFHIHGLGAAIVSMLGRSMIHILPEFNVAAFYAALRDFAPTWYTAVPTIHQNVLRAASTYPEIVDQIARNRQLKFIRSGSAPMPAGVPDELERVFNTRYVEAAGATECSAYICSNAPSSRKIGSVGRPMPGNEVLILDPAGKPLGPNEEGEIVARGPGVFGGYEGQPQLTSETFVDGYFRTGDLGYYDDEGFFYISGRLKEQINRAGMKISPREVDDVIARHPAVHQVATFAVPDPTLGDEVHAAVVLKPGQTVSELDLQRFLAQSLASYKVPRAIHFLTAIPTNATGKIVRVKLAENLGITGQPQASASATATPPVTPTQLAVAAIFSRILKTNVDSIEFDFQSAGGDSIQAMDLSLELERQFGRQIPVSSISANTTVKRLSELLESDGWKPQPAPPVVFRAAPAGQPTLFCFPGVGGNVWCYAAVASRLPNTLGVIGLSLPGSDALEPPLDQMSKLVDRFVAAIRAHQPTGPYLLTGYSFGGRIAFEVCRRLVAEGESIQNLILIDTAGPDWPRPYPLHRRAVLSVRRIAKLGIRGWLEARRSRSAGMGGMTPEEVIDGLMLNNAGSERQAAQLKLLEASATVSREWRPQPLGIPVTILRAATCAWKDCDTSDPAMGWSDVAPNAKIEQITGSHGTLFHEPDVQNLAQAIAKSIG